MCAACMYCSTKFVVCGIVFKFLFLKENMDFENFIRIGVNILELLC